MTFAKLDPAKVHRGGIWHNRWRGAMRLYAAICSAIEAWAERTRTETLEAELENVDWALTSGLDDDG